MFFLFSTGSINQSKGLPVCLKHKQGLQ